MEKHFQPRDAPSSKAPKHFSAYCQKSPHTVCPAPPPCASAPYRCRRRRSLLREARSVLANRANRRSRCSPIRGRIYARPFALRPRVGLDPRAPRFTTVAMPALPRAASERSPQIVPRASACSPSSRPDAAPRSVYPARPLFPRAFAAPIRSRPVADTNATTELAPAAVPSSAIAGSGVLRCAWRGCELRRALARCRETNIAGRSSTHALALRKIR